MALYIYIFSRVFSHSEFLIHITNLSVRSFAYFQNFCSEPLILHFSLSLHIHFTKNFFFFLCSGPKLFKEPSFKSNKFIIHSALSRCCLAGKVNESQKKKIVEVHHERSVFRTDLTLIRPCVSVMPK